MKFIDLIYEVYMKKILIHIFILLILSFNSCTKKNDSDAAHTKNPENNQSEQTDSTVPENAIALEGFYATSINLPHSKFGPENLFDNGENSVWQTMPGAGPDEGVYLSFESAISVLKVIVKTQNLQPVNYVRLYVNGTETRDYKFNEEIRIGKNVKTLYFRLIRGEGIETTQNVSVSEIEIYDDSDSRYNLIPPQKYSGSITASSSLSPVESYNVDFLFDSRPDFGWADGNPDKTGNGEFLQFDFDSEVTIDSLKIWNGYQRSDVHFNANERINTFEFGLTNGETTSYTFKDDKVERIVLSSPLKGKSFIFKVSDIIPGDKYKDLVISEIRFFNGEKSFVMDTGNVEKRKSELLAQAKSRALINPIIDRRLNYVAGETADSYLEQSLILRSNGSFILWFLEESPDSSKTRYADGNWQLMSDNQIKIFGRLHTIDQFIDIEEYDPYGGGDSGPQAAEINSIQIFSDTLTIDSAYVNSGKSLFDPFQI
jgi:hypothetical protein